MQRNREKQQNGKDEKSVRDFPGGSDHKLLIAKFRLKESRENH